VRRSRCGRDFSVNGKWLPRHGTFLSPEADLSTLNARFAVAVAGIEVAQVTGVSFDVAIGRGLAWCVHPHLSWRRLTARGRVMLVAAYVSASYVTVLTLLLAR
jgi:hypothetical protein